MKEIWSYFGRNWVCKFFSSKDGIIDDGKSFTFKNGIDDDELCICKILCLIFKIIQNYELCLLFQIL